MMNKNELKYYNMNIMHVLCNTMWLPIELTQAVLEQLVNKYGHGTIKLLFSNQCEDTAGQTPLMVACQCAAMNLHIKDGVEDPAVKFIQYLLQEFECDYTFQTQSQGTPFIKAVESGNVRLAKYFIQDLNQSVNQTDLSDTTALYTAVFKGNQPMVRLLLSHGADPMKRGP